MQNTILSTVINLMHPIRGFTLNNME